ncbi:CocE/NonD family hydrolase [Dactylosporangium sp. CA-139066]|uniref:CocE/NonD family hydrolase n=1 Tax=Dactylosporangium sp. CA-139066 TaxID=3239930 RepID=UPI003D93ECD9
MSLDVSPDQHGSPDEPAGTGAGFRTRVYRDVRLPTADPAVTLSADLYRPVTGQPVPGLVTVQPYRKDFLAGGTYAGPARWFAEHGYASLVVDHRGIGASDGQRRPEFDRDEGDDAIAAIDWIAAQPWCTGAVGAWGMSYAANTTLRVASLRPPHLRAAVAVAHGLDAGRDSIHPDGSRGDLHALANRGSAMLLQQLLPPLAGYADPGAQRRWRARLRTQRPMVLDYARAGADDPIWAERAIDGSRIVVPVLCAGGWRDGFTHAVIDAYERIRGPKRLVMGPWGHVMPQDSAHHPVDFLALMAQWWDHWLRGVPNDAATSPPVALHLDGPVPQWRGYAEWPPPGRRVVLAADGGTLTPATPDLPRRQPGTHVPDPSVGTLRGLAGLGLGETCPPQDQHDDDLRSLCATGEPAIADLLLAGRPEVFVRIAPDEDGRVVTPARLVVRLCGVEPSGRSTLISAGTLRPDHAAGEHRILLRPVHHRVPAGTRLRIALGDADFPRLTPLSGGGVIRVAGLRLVLPVAGEHAGTAVDLPARTTDTPARPGAATPPGWLVERDHVGGATTVTVAGEVPHTVSPDGHVYRLTSALRAQLPGACPQAVVTSGTHTAEVWLTTGERVRASASVRSTQDTLHAHGVVRIGAFTVFEETWTAELTREESRIRTPNVTAG